MQCLGRCGRQCLCPGRSANYRSPPVECMASKTQSTPFVQTHQHVRRRVGVQAQQGQCRGPRRSLYRHSCSPAAPCRQRLQCAGHTYPALIGLQYYLASPWAARSAYRQWRRRRSTGPAGPPSAPPRATAPPPKQAPRAPPRAPSAAPPARGARPPAAGARGEPVLAAPWPPRRQPGLHGEPGPSATGCTP